MMESYPPELALFDAPDSTIAVQKVEYVEYRPTSQLNSGPLQFHVPPSSSYIDLSRTKLCLKIRIAQADGTPAADAAAVAPVNLVLHSLWEQVDIQIQQKTVSSTGGQSYGYRAMIETLLQYGRGAKQTFLQAQGFYKDTGGFVDSMVPDLKGNRGWVSRFALFDGGRTVDLQGPLLSDICQQPRALLDGVELQVRMWPAKSEFVLASLEGDAAKYRIVVVEASLRVCKITAIPAVVLAHTETLQKFPALYPFTRTELKTFQVNEGQYGFHLEDLFQSDVPNRVVVAMVSADAFNGKISTNPYHFKHFDLAKVGLFLDDHSIPGKPLETDFSGGNYMEAFNTLFQVGDGDEGCDITRADYLGGYTLFVFRLFPDQNPNNVPPTSRGNVRISGTFRHALPENITMLVYAQFPAILQIDAARSIQI